MGSPSEKGDLSWGRWAVTMDPLAESFILNCPVCGNAYLHHEVVEFWTREEQDGPSSVQILGQVTGDYVPDRSHNPSSRRDAIRVRFRCEQYCIVPPLDIVQHKGQTFFEWGDP